MNEEQFCWICGEKLTDEEWEIYKSVLESNDPCYCTAIIKIREVIKEKDQQIAELKAKLKEWQEAAPYHIG